MLFGLVCYDQDVEVSKQATYLLISEYLPTSNNSSSYCPTPEDIINLMEDYGKFQLVKLEFYPESKQSTG